MWDGRGDALEDARLTTVDGRMADDLRLKGTHFRVMAHVGRQNHRRGWLRVSQTELAERWACHRNSVNRAFADLVDWGYLKQRTQEEAGESFCLYKVVLDGEGDEQSPAKPARAQKPEPTDAGDDAGADAAGGVHNPLCTPASDAAGGSAQPIVHMCTVGEYTRAQWGSTPPSGDGVNTTRERTRAVPRARERAHRLSPTDAEKKTPPLPPETIRDTDASGAEGGGGIGKSDQSGVASGRSSAVAASYPASAFTPERADQPRFTARWDRAARDAVVDLGRSVTRSHVVDFIAALSGTLHPPAAADGASWVRLVASKLGDYPPEILRRLADRVLAEQVRDVAPVAKLSGWAEAIAREAAAETAIAADAARRAAVERAALERLAPGIEPDAAPPRLDAIELRRAFVAAVPNGAALDAAWLTDLLVLDRSGHVLRLSVGRTFAARHVGSSQMHGLLVDTARRLWPAVRLVDCQSREKPSATSNGAAA